MPVFSFSLMNQVPGESAHNTMLNAWKNFTSSSSSSSSFSLLQARLLSLLFHSNSSCWGHQSPRSFFKMFVYFEREKERGRGRKREKIPSKLHIQRGAQYGTQSHNCISGQGHLSILLSIPSKAIRKVHHIPSSIMKSSHLLFFLMFIFERER